MEKVLGNWAKLPLEKATDGARVLAGRAVVCPADVHLAVRGGHYRFSTGPKENHSRPSLDVTFRSIAEEYKEYGGGVVLSGLLDDGAAGINALRLHGGLTMALSPECALHSDMPKHAIASGAEYTVDFNGIADRLAEFGERTKRSGLRTGALVSTSAATTRLTCPDCRGVLQEVREGTYEFFRCRVGHAFSSESLNALKEEQIEEALWAAVQVLDEQIDLLDRATKRARGRGDEVVSGRIAARADHQRARAATIRQALPKPAAAIEDSELRENVR
ncbi:MAG: hypothetical protein JO199_05030 [Candidatus Eremiobacteraeota bacterium]|nr:hypothetical protein [Candidatus Eremiobacteraeota bacterium]